MFYVVFFTGATQERGVLVAVDSTVVNRNSEITVAGRLLTDWSAAGFVPPLKKDNTNWMIRVVGGGGTLKPLSTGTMTTTTSGISVPFLGSISMSTLQTIGGVAATGGAGVLGWFLKTRKRRFVSSYLMKVDSTYNQYSMNLEECKKRLAQMKEESIQLLRKGKMDEPHFTLIDNKLNQYLKDLE
jgi:predicted transcriptional regulator